MPKLPHLTMNAFTMKMGSSLLRVLLLAVTLFAGVNASVAEDLHLSGGASVLIDPLGAIKEVRFKGIKVIVLGSVKGRMDSGSRDMLQAFPFVPKNKVKINSGVSDVNVTGTIAQDEGGPEVAEFAITYKEKSDGVLLVRVELTYLVSADIAGPLAFLIRFPVESFQGGALDIESETGAENHYDIEDSVIKMKGFGSEKCTLSKDKMKLVCTAADGTQLNPGDAREWKDSSIWVEACRRWKWAKNYHVSSGQKETIEFTIAFEEKS